jgi:lysozyme
VNRVKLIDELSLDEGLRLKPYLCTAGKLTIGIGRNLDDIGITRAEAITLCHNDIDRCIAELDAALPWWRKMSEPRQRAIVNMCFNLGITRLRTFARTLRALEDRRYDDAAKFALESKWARQVGQRAHRIAELIRKG